MTSNKLLKLCAVVSSLLLAVAFISYRAGAMNWLRESNVPVGEAVNNPPSQLVEGETIEVGESGPLLYSSKSGKVILFDGTQTFVRDTSPADTSPYESDTPPTSIEGERIIMSSSKMMTLPTSPPVPQEEIIMSGSKSSGGF